MQIEYVRAFAYDEPSAGVRSIVECCVVVGESAE